jgi:glycosyltransferase involved in cell wall biosynthesis
VSREPTVSVVMAAYKAAQFLPDAIESALGQTFGDLEVIVIDDGSPDNTATVVQAYLTDERVRYYWQPNAGQCAAKNKGIGLSKGRFVAFLDADDLWLPGKLERQLPLFEDRPDVGVVYGFLAKIDSLGRPLPWEPVPPRRGIVTADLLIENFVPFASSVVRKSLLDKRGGFDPELDMGIDYDLWLRLSAHCEFDFVEEVVGKYRVWEGQMSQKVFQRYSAGMGIMREFLAQYGAELRKADVERGWARTYTGLGDTHLWAGGGLLRAWRDYFRAWMHDTTCWPVYRAMLRSLLTDRAPR